MARGKNEFEDAYSDESFWEKVGRFASAAGREVVEKALVLYYAMLEPDVPTWAKGTIVGALGYFIMPLDAISDVMPAVGYADDLGVLVAALAAVAAHVSPEIRERAAEKLDAFFGEKG
jgi:uncharacterized membrane protein YkvA (DUF1232 family)